MATQESQPFQWHYAEFEDDTNLQLPSRTLFFIITLLAVILILILLILYARWVCRFRPMSIVAAARSINARPQPGPVGLDPTIINNLPITLHRATSSSNVGELAECCICLGVFQDGEKVKILPVCYHCFHSECVDKWLKTQSSCPLCRSSLLQLDSPV